MNLRMVFLCLLSLAVVNVSAGSLAKPGLALSISRQVKHKKKLGYENVRACSVLTPTKKSSKKTAITVFQNNVAKRIEELARLRKTKEEERANQRLKKLLALWEIRSHREYNQYVDGGVYFVHPPRG